jgi:hypothetical protein
VGALVGIIGAQYSPPEGEYSGTLTEPAGHLMQSIVPS